MLSPSLSTRTTLAKYINSMSLEHKRHDFAQVVRDKSLYHTLWRICQLGSMTFMMMPDNVDVPKLWDEEGKSPLQVLIRQLSNDAEEGDYQHTGGNTCDVFPRNSFQAVVEKLVVMELDGAHRGAIPHSEKIVAQFDQAVQELLYEVRQEVSPRARFFEHFLREVMVMVSPRYSWLADTISLLDPLVPETYSAVASGMVTLPSWVTENKGVHQVLPEFQIDAAIFDEDVQATWTQQSPISQLVFLIRSSMQTMNDPKVTRHPFETLVGSLDQFTSLLMVQNMTRPVVQTPAASEPAEGAQEAPAVKGTEPGPQGDLQRAMADLEWFFSDVEPEAPAVTWNGTGEQWLAEAGCIEAAARRAIRRVTKNGTLPVDLNAMISRFTLNLIGPAPANNGGGLLGDVNSVAENQTRGLLRRHDSESVSDPAEDQRRAIEKQRTQQRMNDIHEQYLIQAVYFGEKSMKVKPVLADFVAELGETRFSEVSNEWVAQEFIAKHLGGENRREEDALIRLCQAAGLNGGGGNSLVFMQNLMKQAVERSFDPGRTPTKVMEAALQFLQRNVALSESEEAINIGNFEALVEKSVGEARRLGESSMDTARAKHVRRHIDALREKLQELSVFFGEAEEMKQANLAEFIIDLGEGTFLATDLTELAALFMGSEETRTSKALNRLVEQAVGFNEQAVRYVAETVVKAVNGPGAQASDVNVLVGRIEKHVARSTLASQASGINLMPLARELVGLAPDGSTGDQPTSSNLFPTITTEPYQTAERVAETVDLGWTGAFMFDQLPHALQEELAGRVDIDSFNQHGVWNRGDSASYYQALSELDKSEPRLDFWALAVKHGEDDLQVIEHSFNRYLGKGNEEVILGHRGPIYHFLTNWYLINNGTFVHGPATVDQAVWEYISRNEDLLRNVYDGQVEAGLLFGEEVGGSDYNGLFECQSFEEIVLLAQRDLEDHFGAFHAREIKSYQKLRELFKGAAIDLNEQVCRCVGDNNVGSSAVILTESHLRYALVRRYGPAGDLRNPTMEVLVPLIKEAYKAYTDSQSQ